MTDNSTDLPRFDPRFNPAFQPGFSPEEQGRSLPSPAVTAPRIPDRGASAHIPGSATTPEGVPGQIVLQNVDDESADPQFALRRLNPFLIALWILSLGFIAAGAYLLLIMGQKIDGFRVTGGGNSSDYFIVQAFMVGAPMLIVLGLATGTGTLFLLATLRTPWVSTTK